MNDDTLDYFEKLNIFMAILCVSGDNLLITISFLVNTIDKFIKSDWKLIMYES